MISAGEELAARNQATKYISVMITTFYTASEIIGTSVILKTGHIILNLNIEVCMDVIKHGDIDF